MFAAPGEGSFKISNFVWNVLKAHMDSSKKEKRDKKVIRPLLQKLQLLK